MKTNSTPISLYISKKKSYCKYNSKKSVTKSLSNSNQTSVTKESAAATVATAAAANDDSSSSSSSIVLTPNSFSASQSTSTSKESNRAVKSRKFSHEAAAKTEPTEVQG